MKRCFDSDLPLPTDIAAFRDRISSISRSYEPVLSVGDWISAQLVNAVTQILLSEVMGYRTSVDYVSGTGAVYECVADGTHTFNLETWVNTKLTQREEWVITKEMVVETPIGYHGREGIFLSHLDDAKKKLSSQCLKPFLEHWQALTFPESLALLPTDRSTNLTQPYLCTTSTHEQCFSGRYVPPHCCAESGCEDPSPFCHEVHLASPGWNQGWFEAMVSSQCSHGAYPRSFSRTIHSVARKPTTRSQTSIST